MNYVVNMLARPEKVRVTQLSHNVKVDSAMDLYLKNSYVCLRSVLLNNPNIKCLLIVSFEIDKKWRALFDKIGVEIIYVKFGGFTIDDKYDWGIVQYRYDVLQYLCNYLKADDKIILLDTDVVCVGKLDEVFAELTERAMFYDVQHPCNHPDRLNILNNYQKIYNTDVRTYFTHWGVSSSD